MDGEEASHKSRTEVQTEGVAPPQLSSPRLARSRPREAMSPTVAPMDDATFMHVLKHTLETGLQRKQVITVDVISDPN